jgi:hypothetical protein
MGQVPGSLRALLANLIDYAGLYPPAELSLPVVSERYRAFRESPERWILNRLVLPATLLEEVLLDPDWPIALLVEADPGPLPPQVETLETRALAVSSKLPTYYEASLAEVVRGFAKFRTGGLVPEAIPSSQAIARFLCDSAAHRIAFKATAGLHHPVRRMAALTYTPDSPQAVMHGFLNVFAAAALAWHGTPQSRIADLLEERDPSAFGFGGDAFDWKGVRVTTAQIRDARRDFAHSFGSCSFEEPVSELRRLGLLP